MNWSVSSPCVAQGTSTGYTNYARDGTAIMQSPSLLRFFVRCLLLLCVFLCQQLPRFLEVGIDRKKFLESFSWRSPGASLRTARSVAEDWPLGPDGLVHPGEEEAVSGEDESSDSSVSPRSRALQPRWLCPALPISLGNRTACPRVLMYIRTVLLTPVCHLDLLVNTDR